MIDIKVQVHAEDLETLLDKLKNPKPALQEIGRMLVASTRERIKDTKRSPENRPWAAWSNGTRLARTKRGTAARGLLYESGALLNSIQYQISGKTVIVGSNSPYASFLQDGTDRMPARPFVGISQDDNSRIENILRAHLKTA
jgi:phage virion morphogenesis protein